MRNHRIRRKYTKKSSSSSKPSKAVVIKTRSWCRKYWDKYAKYDGSSTPESLELVVIKPRRYRPQGGWDADKLINILLTYNCLPLYAPMELIGMQDFVAENCTNSHFARIRNFYGYETEEFLTYGTPEVNPNVRVQIGFYLRNTKSKQGIIDSLYKKYNCLISSLIQYNQPKCETPNDITGIRNDCGQYGILKVKLVKSYSSNLHPQAHGPQPNFDYFGYNHLSGYYMLTDMNKAVLTIRSEAQSGKYGNTWYRMKFENRDSKYCFMEAEECLPEFHDEYFDICHSSIILKHASQGDGIMIEPFHATKFLLRYKQDNLKYSYYFYHYKYYYSKYNQINNEYNSIPRSWNYKRKKDCGYRNSTDQETCNIFRKYRGSFVSYLHKRNWSFGNSNYLNSFYINGQWRGYSVYYGYYYRRWFIDWNWYGKYNLKYYLLYLKGGPKDQSYTGNFISCF